MDIEGLGSRICTILFKENFITSLDEIYSLKNKKEELLKLEGFGELSINKLLESIENSKKKPFSNLLTSFGIEGVGVEIAELISSKFSSLVEIKEGSESNNFNEILENLEGIGPVVAMKITDWFSEEKNKILIDNFIKLNIGYEKKENANNSNILEGKSFVVTGSFDEYSRNDIESIIKTHGGKVSSKVSSKTSNLILGSNPGSKLIDAQENNIAIIDITEFFKAGHRLMNNWIILGLGNPDKKYEKTKHNVPWWVLDVLDKKFSQYKQYEKNEENYFEIRLDFETYSIYLIYPSTYVNNSGLAAKDLLKMEKFSMENYYNFR